MKKLIPALCMLLVAATLLGTSTYAWFSMNEEVTASSMQIKATTDANLYIAKGASVDLNAITGTAVTDLGVNASSVKPADMSDDAGTVTVRVANTYTSAPTVNSAGTAATYTDIGTVTSTASEPEVVDYCAVGFVSIARKQTTASTFKLAPKCTVTLDGTSNLNKALRAGLIIDGKLYESNDANLATGTINFTFSNVEDLDDNKAYSVALLLWFEGEDSDCFVNNAIDLTNNTAEWSFTLVP